MYLLYSLLWLLIKGAQCRDFETVYRFGHDRKMSPVYSNRSLPVDWDRVGCVRLESDPIPLPPRWTWCQWFYRELKMHYLVFFSLSSTTDGDSYPEHSARYNTTGWYDLAYGENKSVIPLYMSSLWIETYETYYGGHWDDMGKLEPYEYNEWNFFCITVDHEVGKQTVFLNGKQADEKFVEDRKKEGLEKKINQTYSPNNPMITDVLLGCWPFSSWWNAAWARFSI